MTKAANGTGGIIPPVITPLTEDLNLDAEAYGKIIQHVIDGGVHGVFILGTNGEGACLNNDIRHNAIRSAVSHVAHQVPLFVNSSTPSFIESRELCRIAAEEGADYVVLSPPFYFDMNQEELYRFFSQLASISSLPVYLYNIPQYTKSKIGIETVSRLAKHENILGLKDSSGDMDYMKQLLQNRSDPDFKILVGTELLLMESISLGADGGIHGGANVTPELYVRMYHASLNQQAKEQRRLQDLMKEVRTRIYEVPDSPVGLIIGLKYALSVMGLCSEQMAMPVYEELTIEKKKIIEEFVKLIPSLLD